MHKPHFEGVLSSYAKILARAGLYANFTLVPTYWLYEFVSRAVAREVSIDKFGEYGNPRVDSSYAKYLMICYHFVFLMLMLLRRWI